MSISLRNILLLGLCVSLGACAFKKEDAEEKQRQDLIENVHKKIQEEKENAKLALTRSTIKVEFKERDIGFYDLVLTWPESVGRMEVFINNAPAGEVKGKNVFTKAVSQGDEVSFKLRAYEPISIGGAFMGEFEDVALTPKDFLVYRTISLSKNLTAENINRAYIRQDAKIITNGYNFKLSTNTLLVEESKEYAESGNPVQFSQIITNESSEPTDSFRTSKIEIIATQATGKLFVAMIGRDGINGKNGTDILKDLNRPPQPPIAKNGADGKSGTTTGGKVCSKIQRENGCEPKAPECSLQPTNGQDGTNGENGLDGGDGSIGGNTGDIKVRIDEFSDFYLEVYQQPGKGGRGGIGAPGQLGGKGGAPGNNHNLCRPAMPGKNGLDGEAGKNGKDGADGSKGLIESNVRPRII